MFLPELISRSSLHPGDQSVLTSRDAQIYGLTQPLRHTLQFPSAPVPLSRLAAHPRSPYRAGPVRGKLQTSRMPMGLKISHGSRCHLTNTPAIKTALDAKRRPLQPLFQ